MKKTMKSYWEKREHVFGDTRFCPNCGYESVPTEYCGRCGKKNIHKEDEEMEYPMNIKIKYFDDEMPRLELVEGKSDWFDLRAAERVELKAGESALIPLGVAMELPSGYEAHVVPRSSTFKKWGIIQTNHMGVIDCSYSGDHDQWHMPVLATRDTVVEKFDRICQFRIIENQPLVRFEEVEHLRGVDRGGFGSTGVQ